MGLSNKCLLLKETFYCHCEILCGWYAVITRGLLYNDEFVPLSAKSTCVIPMCPRSANFRLVDSCHQLKVLTLKY